MQFAEGTPNHQKPSTQPDQELVRKDERRLWADREPNIAFQKSLICGNLVRQRPPDSSLSGAASAESQICAASADTHGTPGIMATA
jgi:hypothetical protein